MGLHTSSQSTGSSIEKSSDNYRISRGKMKQVYEKIKTPYKYGIVLMPSDTGEMVDSPTIFRMNDQWYMTYIVYDGRGYETYIAESNDLLHWEKKGKILSFTENTWDASQKAGYPALVDKEWGGDYELHTYKGKYWMSYLGGATRGYEAGTLGVGMAYTKHPTKTKEWNRIENPVLLPEDYKARWFENDVIYKSSVIQDTEGQTGHRFVMYYNAKGDTATYESIGMAVSDDMVNWKRFGDDPVITEQEGISGDAQIVKMDDLYVMFYFGAFWKPGAFERFACSRDLVDWTKWKGNDLVAPSEDYDRKYAHKPWVIKWKGTVYHFYTAVGKYGRVIALATSKDIGESELPGNKN
ncbi:MAG: glycosylase [Bacteroidales bacterium]|nr:glycosylase [Bacteroidales bacterium]